MKTGIKATKAEHTQVIKALAAAVAALKPDVAAVVGGEVAFGATRALVAALAAKHGLPDGLYRITDDGEFEDIRKSK